MNTNDFFNNAEAYGNISTIAPHPKTIDKDAMAAVATNATGISSQWPSDPNFLSLVVQTKTKEVECLLNN